MLYTYDRKFLIHRRVNLLKVTLISMLMIGVPMISAYYYGISHGFNRLSEGEKAIVIKKADQFSQDKLVQMLKDLNVRHPHIVIAQSMIETGHWKSGIFLENNNLFGMKEAKQRITTAEGTNRNHAMYTNWRESVYDYAFYQCRYLSSLRTESEYFQYLSASYAEDPNYVAAVRQAIEKYKLRELFQQ